MFLFFFSKLRRCGQKQHLVQGAGEAVVQRAGVCVRTGLPGCDRHHDPPGKTGSEGLK